MKNSFISDGSIEVRATIHKHRPIHILAIPIEIVSNATLGHESNYFGAINFQKYGETVFQSHR